MRALLLAGGAGTRLWPLSTEGTPKQFLKLLSERSLLEETYFRVEPLALEGVFIATTVQYADRTLQEIPTLPADRLILEPARRNTGPALIAAALRFERDGDAIVAAIPSDQTVRDDEAFRGSLARAAMVAEEGGIVTLGVVPTHPETQFGYLETAREEQSVVAGTHRVLRFVEKPSREAAERYVASGAHLWNAGIFVFRPSALVSEAKRVVPELYAGCEEYEARRREGHEEKARLIYEKLPAISIDFGVMEKARNVFAIPLDAGWSDVGSYRAIREMRGADGRGNLVLGERPVIVLGISDCAVVSTEGGTLVMSFAAESELKQAVERLNSDALGGPEA
jgi:mannose-1-phosphate guanylyltransferase/mannose-6-phosphate isomerase